MMFLSRKWNKNIFRTKVAFSLVEVVVILFISSIGIMATLSLAVRSVYLQNAKKDLTTAIFLANEGLDLVTNIRDTNMIMGLDYDNWDGLGSVGVGQNLYTVDFFTLLASSTTSIDDAFLQEDSDGFFLHDDSFDDTVFSRLITIDAETSASSSIESWVRWRSRGNVFDYKVSSVLYDLSY